MIARPLSIDAPLVEELAVGKHPAVEQELVQLARRGALKGVIKKPPRFSATLAPGKKVGLLTLVRLTELRKNNNRYWLAVCACGSKRTYSASNLRCGNTLSCGCAANVKHGLARRGRTADEYKTWQSMWDRCTNPEHAQFNRYGARGISVCARWRDVRVFLRDVGPRPSKKHTLDRIDNDGNYKPSNVRWATAKEQARNRRNNFRLTYRGHTRLIVEWAEELGVAAETLKRRLRNGWSPKETIETPVRGWSCK